MKAILVIISLSFIFFSCSKSGSSPSTPSASLATLSTTSTTSIGSIIATSGGNVSSDGGATVTARGVCWGTSSGPVATGNHTVDGGGTGAFTSSLSGLTPSTIYYVRAYATNSVGTAYGNEISFTTSGSLATLATTTITSITSSAATSGGNISSDGGTTVTARGVCWGTTTGPIATGSHTTDGSGTGSFISNINGLASGTTYYVRAYATNSAGTAYGNEINFTTSVSSQNVYVAGSSKVGGFDVAMIWKNGVGTTLTGGTSNAAAKGVFVSGTDVYVVGYEQSGARYYAKVWKNGVGTTLSVGTGDALANSVFVLGSDVYVAGYENDGFHDISKYWKNGVAVILPGNIQGFTNSIYVSGTDVYVAGYRDNGFSVATLWKNAVATELTNGTGNNAHARSVYVSGADVYVAGFDGSAPINDRGRIWKNGAILGTLPGSFYATSVYVAGADVYAGGQQIAFVGANSYAIVWKNGVGTTISTKDGSIVNSMYVLGTDVYAAGDNVPGPSSFYVATVWKNGVATALIPSPFSDSHAYSVFVTP